MFKVFGKYTTLKAIKHTTNTAKTQRKEVIAIKKASNSNKNTRKIRPALSPEARENQLISLAMDLVEQRLLDGTASPNEVTSILRLGTTKAKLEKEKLEVENELNRAKKEALESQKRMEEMYAEAITSMREYAGKGSNEE